MKYELHPLAELFPPMSEAEYEALKASIKKDGFDKSHPIWLLDGKVIDGRHRAKACAELDVEPETRDYKGDDPLGFVVRGNLHRRHLNESQRHLVGARLANLTHGGDRRSDQAANLPLVSQADAAELLSVSPRGIRDAKVVIDNGAAALVKAVESGDVAVSLARKLAALPKKEQLRLLAITDKREQREAIKRALAELEAERRAEEQRKSEGPGELTLTAASAPGKGSYSVAEWNALQRPQRERIIAAGFESSGEKMNAQEGTSIEWARWSHNTVTGCEHDCPYCYARDIAERYYPQKFAPTFHPSRLAGPGSIKLPPEASKDPSYRNIFANSMSDLFGQWVPAEWIEATIEMAKRNPKWQFLTLTKFPQRAAKFAFPDNWWMGTTVDAQCRVKNAEEAFAKIECKTKWLSVEPLLEPLTFSRLELFQWVVIGGASRSNKTPEWIPPFDWLARLHMQARDAGCRLYHKTNLNLHESMRVREFPWAKPIEPALPKTFRYLKGM